MKLENKKVVILKFQADGKAHPVKELDDLWGQLTTYLNKEDEIAAIMDHSQMYEWRRLELLKEKEEPE